MNAANVRLFMLLARLFPDRAQSDLLTAQAGIDKGRIHAEQGPMTRWFQIVLEAEKAGLTAALVEAAAQRYPNNAGLLALRDELVGVPVVEAGQEESQ